MQLTEVVDRKTGREFLEVPLSIYRNDPNWIRPLDKDIETIFDPALNKFFRHGEAIRWVLKDDNSVLIGRVATFINEKTANTFDQPTGGLGFFECIDDKDAAFTLFDNCIKWLQERNMEAADGPINFGEKDRWWGLLIDGYTEPNYCMGYNPSYYINFFEEYGFKTYFEQYTYSRSVGAPLPKKYAEKADRISRNPAYSFRHLEKKYFDKYIEDFRYIYNKAWTKHAGFKPMAKEQAKALMGKMKPVLDENILWFAYYKDEPAGFFIMLPELNQIFKHLNGKLDWLGKLKFLWHQKRRTCRKMFGVAYGVIPEHQGKGLEGAIVVAAAKKVQPLKRYDVFEMNWIGDFNPKMMHIAESVGAKIVKTHVTYRKLFDESIEFKRAPIIK
ncbi:hypothetical protein JYT51_00205 [Candidatus Amoebophilus asiaticus]|nr:hypothetical protein [Candidatus Amoebophilus asiaticus]